jgi:hypothetical protein
MEYFGLYNKPKAMVRQERKLTGFLIYKYKINNDIGCYIITL